VMECSVPKAARSTSPALLAAESAASSSLVKFSIPSCECKWGTW
jgi:N-acetylglutamate synthase/N-acetylornithine aminotransferase